LNKGQVARISFVNNFTYSIFLQFVTMKLYTAVGHLYTPGAEVVNSSSAPISKRTARNSDVYIVLLGTRRSPHILCLPLLSMTSFSLLRY